MSATDARERAILDGQFGSGSPTTWHLGLSTTTPNDDGSGFTEPVGGGYSRVSVPNNTTSFPAATTGSGVSSKTNGAVFQFPNPSGTWGAVIHYGWFLGASGGTPEFTNPLDASISPKNGNTPVQFDIGQIVMSCD